MLKSAKEHTPAVKMMITPMIDVTFLLLIFFMLLPFRSLERKLAAYVPTDKGQAHTRKLIPPETKISVALFREEGTERTKVKLHDQMLGYDDRGFAALDLRVRQIHVDAPDMKGEIDATAEVPHGDVIRCLDAFQSAGVTNVEFRGTPPPGRDG
jgi:biopolymer transport protein ExbD